MKKKIIVRYVFMSLSVGIMSLIFWFSAQNGEQSDGMSQNFSAFVQKICRPFLSQNVLAFFLAHIRKGAHIFLYASLGISVSICVFTFRFGHGWLLFVLPVLICLLYAFTDELHQVFVEGRAGLFTDVLVDAVGFVTATLTANAIRWGIIKLKAKKKGCNR